MQNARFPRRPAVLCAAVIALCVLAAAAPAAASVVRVNVNFYQLDDGRTFKAPWDLAQELIAAGEPAIVVMEAKASKDLMQLLLQTLESFNIPTLLTKAKDFKELVKRGVIVAKPKPAP
ncbi:hypothetical protein [Desulfolutivibrio sulfodismutans]|uniref:hypothetical protein n=1 Tax=Desulfolutivibrio sulfodismutans TaxID=63561 RepID=UPI001FE9AF6D|nr:hypothetical protein [Desulfolutivibrio sulfodismutans]